MNENITFSKVIFNFINCEPPYLLFAEMIPFRVYKFPSCNDFVFAGIPTNSKSFSKKE